MTPSIRIEGIGKRYRMGGGSVAYRTVRESVMRGLAVPLRLLGRRPGASTQTGEIWALRDVSFDVEPGEVVGIIGRNGAGKSTLLKILARITRPTTGRAVLRGRVGCLLDVATGFHSELTGRENIYLNGVILGMRSREVSRKLERMVEFSGVEEFIDTPLKYYSDGMRVRLAFSISAHLDTEIMLADEVLAVGDVAFQKKCTDEMGALAKSGRTVLFISHNMTAVGDLCSRTVLLERGRVIGVGRSHEVIRKYLTNFSVAEPETVVHPPHADLGAAIRRILLSDSTGTPTTTIDWRSSISVAVEFVVSKLQPALSIGVTLVNQLGVRTLHSWAVFQGRFEPGFYVVRGRFPAATLSPGRYHVQARAERYGVEPLHIPDEVGAFEVIKTSGEFGYDLEAYGLMYSDVQWTVEVPAEGPQRR